MNTKKLLLALALTVASYGTALAQKFAYVDVEYILSQMPEYKQAQTELDNIAAKWQEDIQKKMDDIDAMYKSYQADQVLLTDDMRRRREDEIMNKEKEVKDLQKKKFGYEGELFKKRQELVKPVQDKVYSEIQKLVKQRAYDFIFDKSSGTVMLYSNSDYDMSNTVLKGLGITPKNENLSGDKKDEGGRK